MIFYKHEKILKKKDLKTIKKILLMKVLLYTLKNKLINLNF